MSAEARARIRLCGRLEAAIGDRDATLPGRQGRVLFAYLVVNRRREVARDELIDVLWPEQPPADPGETLSALLSRVRREVGPGAIEGRRQLRLALLSPEVDLERAQDATRRAEVALAEGDPAAARREATAALDATAAGFLPGDDLPWVESVRREVGELRVRALEAAAGAGLALGAAELPGAEQAARALVDAAPFRESGHLLLMEVLAARGDVAEALRAYDDLRVLLRDELGTAPGSAAQELHGRLLKGGETPPAAPERPASEERKLVSVLSTEPAPAGDPDDPEELRAALAAIHERLAAVVGRFGGSAQGPAPTLAVFGAAAAHEDDAERAIRAALAACERRDVRRAAVASGEAIVSGPERAATGQVMRAAAELLGEAPAGRVAVDAETARAARRSVEFEEAGGVMLVRGLREGTRPRAVTPLVGRVRELGALAELHGAVGERGSPLLVTLTGNAGVGKSRLTEEFAARAAERGATVHWGRCLPHGERIALWPLREVLCEAAGIALDDSATAARSRLQALGDALGLEAVTTEALAAGAGIALGDAGREEAVQEDVAEEIAMAWPAFLTAAARRAPLVVVIEDLHWAEPQLLATLERAVARSEGPLLVLATARPEFAEENPAWGRRGGRSDIALDGLSVAHTRELVGELMPEKPDALRERVAELAEGNPFFAEEMARHVAAGGDPSGSLPHGLRALVAARIDALPAAEKRALQHAAVVGRRFWLSALTPDDSGEPLSAVLASLEDRGLVVARPLSALPGESEYWFAHGLTREVAYRSIPRAARGRTHEAVAAWIERLAGDRREEFIYLLAYHCEAAATLPQAREETRVAAVEALLEAGSAARRGLLSGDPIGLADRALALARGDRERLAGLELRARAFHAAVRGDEALAAYLEAIELARALGDPAATANLRAHAALLCTRYMGAFTDDSWMAPARRFVEEGLAETGEETESFEVGALLLARSWGRARWRDVPQRDRPGARRDVERALEISDRVDSNYLRAHALEGLTWLVLEEGFCEAEAMGDRLLGSGEVLSNRVEAHECLGVAAICFARAGRFDRARAAAAEATRQAPGLSPHRALHAGAAEVIALAPAGAFTDLLTATERITDLAEDEGERICGTGLVALAGRILAVFEAGEGDEAERAVELLRRLAPYAGRFRSYGHPAAELLRPVVGAEETRRLAYASEWVRDAGVTVMRLRALLPVLDDAVELRAAVADARALAKSACTPPLGWIANVAEARLTAREGDPGAALRQAEDAAGALDRYGESYTGALLLAELLPELSGVPESADVARRTAARLTDMGALSSARRLEPPAVERG